MGGGGRIVAPGRATTVARAAAIRPVPVLILRRHPMHRSKGLLAARAPGARARAARRGPAAHGSPDGEEDRRPPRADDARGEGRPAESVQQPAGPHRPGGRPGPAEGGLRADPLGARRLDAQRERRRGHPQGAGAGALGQPAEDPDDLRLRRDPRLQDDLPDPARRGRELGPRRRSSAPRAWRRRRPRRRDSTGPSRRWSTSRATRAGAASWRAPARTPTSAP